MRDNASGDLFGGSSSTAKPPAQEKRAPFEIEPGTRPVRCNAFPKCKAEVYWITHPKSGRGHPVTVADPESGTPYADCRAPTETEPGYGRSHFSDCPDAERFRKRK